MARVARVIMTCGMICSGKSTYAEKLRKELNAAVLSVDEIMLALFGNDVGDKHDEYVERLERYLFGKSAELVEAGINVILDWGFWTKAERDYAREFYRSHGIDCEIHYIDVSAEEWAKRRQKRNELAAAGKISAYLVDDGLAEKFGRIFEKPDRDEVDAWIE